MKTNEDDDDEECCSCNHPKEEYEIFGALSAEDKQTWGELKTEDELLTNQIEELLAKQEIVNAKRQLFWCALEKKIGIYDRSMSIMEDNLYLAKPKSSYLHQ